MKPHGESAAQRRPGAYPRRHMANLKELPLAPPAQRRPGAYPRRHWGEVLLHSVVIHRSTKAGSLSPATRAPCGQGRAACSSLNEGRELIPGDTASRLASAEPATPSLNEGRELIPGDTWLRLRGRGAARRRSTKAGSLSPATPRALGARWPPAAPLNEGRELIPGDTVGFPSNSLARTYAQRRPGAYPRRHVARGSRHVGAHPAQRRPGAYPRRHAIVRGSAKERADHAQRRPGAYPRRHLHRRVWPLIPRRAQRRPGAYPRRHRTRRRSREAPGRTLNEGRELIPGDTSRRCRWAIQGRPLNEGRELIPGDTNPETRHTRHTRHRSTKAGSLSPATPVRWRRNTLADRTAQRRPGAYPRRHATFARRSARSAAAQRRPGAYPRRHVCCRASGCRRAIALNEGRELIPGDTGDAERRHAAAGLRSTKAGSLSPATHPEVGYAKTGNAAQRRPGAYPRRHLPAASWRSTKAGSLSPATRATPLNEGRELIPGDTKAGSLSPATPSTPQRPLRRECHGVVAPSRWNSAQRRPGAYPRRHC